jgi:hypothetical protein
MSMNGKKPSGWWLAQGFIAILLLAVAIRAPQLLGRKDPAPPRALPVVLPTRAAPRPEALEGAARIESPAESRVSRTTQEAAPYDPERFGRSRQRASDDASIVVWDLDPEELAWLLAHQREVLTRDLETTPVSGGGLRVAGVREGSFGALRGIRSGDVLEDVNGHPLGSRSELEDFLDDPAYSGSTGWRLSLLRGGEAITIDYRSASTLSSSRRHH